MPSVTDNYNEAWTRGRPVYRRLPLSGYQDNPVIDALTVPIDERFIYIRNILQGLTEKLNPATCPDEWLDYVGYLNGYSGQYWDALWSPQVKRSLAVNSRALWRKRGRAEVVAYILGLHGITHDIWKTGVLRLPLTLPSQFSSPRSVIYVRLPLSYSRTSSQWKEADRTRYNYLHATVKHRVVYDKFYLGAGFSKLGEPLFNRGIG